MKAPNSMKEFLIKKALQEHPVVKRLGTLHSLSLNTNERTCSAEIGLVGEASPIRFSVKYEISRTETGADFQLSEIHSEKQWIDELLKIFLEEKGGRLDFPVKGFAAKMMQLFL